MSLRPGSTRLPAVIFTTRRFASGLLPSPPPLTDVPNPDTSPHESRQVHAWVDSFRKVNPAEALRGAKGITMSFSRSSGPGGQNVNKVNTKATTVLARDPHYASSSHSLLVTSTSTRSQAQNINDCLAKLHKIILAGATAHLRNPTEEETKKRVQAHLNADKARKRDEKQRRSGVKQGRRSSGSWD